MSAAATSRVPPDADDRERALAGQEHGRQVGGRIAVDQRAADGPAVAHLLVGDRAPSPGRPGPGRRCPAGRRGASSRRSATGRSRAARRAARGPCAGPRAASAPPAAASSAAAASGRRPAALASSPGSAPSARRRASRVRHSRTRAGSLGSSLRLVDGRPDPHGRERHVQVGHSERAQRVDHGIGHRSRPGDRARLADALDAERVDG